MKLFEITFIRQSSFMHMCCDNILLKSSTLRCLNEEQIKRFQSPRGKSEILFFSRQHPNSAHPLSGKCKSGRLMLSKTDASSLTLFKTVFTSPLPPPHGPVHGRREFITAGQCGGGFIWNFRKIISLIFYFMFFFITFLLKVYQIPEFC